LPSLPQPRAAALQDLEARKRAKREAAFRVLAELAAEERGPESG
jgi:hypothetical protein